MKIINAIIDGKTTKLVKVNEFYPHMKVKNYYFISEDGIIYNKTSKGYRPLKWLTSGTPEPNIFNCVIIKMDDNH